MLDSLMTTLPIMGWGMLGIFIVIGIIWGCVFALDKIFPADKEK